VRLAREEPEAGPWRVALLADVVGSLLRSLPAGREAGRPVIMALDGRSNNGKTTLAARIASAATRSAVVHTDDIAWQHSRFGWADLLVDGILTPARQGEPVAYRPPRWQDHGRSGCITVPAGCSLLIVEGVGAGRIETAGLIDALIWVQADQDEADRRGLDRVGRPGQSPTILATQEWMAEEIPFVAADRAWERADLIVCGTPKLAYDPATQLVVAAPVRPAG
jgi:hypothetical protein